MQKLKLKFLNPVHPGAAGTLVVAGFATLAFIAKRKKAKKRARGDLPPTPGPGGEGSVWGNLPAPGSPKDRPGYRPPPEFDFGGWEAWVSPDCNVVVEGARFWDDVTVPLNEMDVVLSSKENALARGARWYLEWSKAAGYTDPKEMVDDMLRILSPLCADAPTITWSNALYSWYENAINNAIEYLDTGTVGNA